MKVYKKYDSFSAKIWHTIHRQIEENFCDRMGKMQEYMKSKASMDPIKLMKAVEKACFSCRVGEKEFNDGFKIIKSFLTNKQKGK